MSRGRDLRRRAMTEVCTGLPPKEWPMCTRRYATTSATGAISLTGSHDRMAAQGPDRCRAVKAVSRRSRSRAARALTGLRRPGTRLPRGHGAAPLAPLRNGESFGCVLCTQCADQR
jgi:hypothetical protein